MNSHSMQWVPINYSKSRGDNNDILSRNKVDIDIDKVNLNVIKRGKDNNEILEDKSLRDLRSSKVDKCKVDNNEDDLIELNDKYELMFKNLLMKFTNMFERLNLSLNCGEKLMRGLMIKGVKRGIIVSIKSLI